MHFILLEFDFKKTCFISKKEKHEAHLCDITNTYRCATLTGPRSSAPLRRKTTSPLAWMPETSIYAAVRQMKAGHHKKGERIPTLGQQAFGLLQVTRIYLLSSMDSNGRSSMQHIAYCH